MRCINNEKYENNLHSLERTWLHFWETNEKGDNKFKVKFARDNSSKTESCLDNIHWLVSIIWFLIISSTLHNISKKIKTSMIIMIRKGLKKSRFQPINLSFSISYGFNFRKLQPLINLILDYS